MIASEKRVGKKPYSNGFPASQAIREAASKSVKAVKALRNTNTMKRRDAAYVTKCKEEVKKAKKELKYKQKHALQLRQEDQQTLAEKYAEKWNIKASKAILVIRESEASKRLHKKQRAFLKPQRDGGITRVFVPAPLTGIQSKESNITDEKTQYEVEDTKEIFNILLRQNFTSLRKSES